jgi:UDP-glucose 4-epimerase
MTNKKVIVTGAAGFIGSHLVDLLIKKNFTVIAIDNLTGGRKKNLKHHLKNKNFKFVNLDINKIKKNSRHFKKAKYVFHLAGSGDIVPSIENPHLYAQNNIMGTINVLEACRYNNVKKIIYAASSSCYGIAKYPTKETYPISPQYPYAFTKFIGEKSISHWSKVYGIKFMSIRIFNAYGPRVKTTGAYGAVFGVFFKQKLENKKLTVVGDGTQGRDFCYVTDIANAFYLAAKSKIFNRIYNVGYGKPNTILKLVKIIGSKIEFIKRRPGEPKYTWANISKIKKELNWKPKVKFEEGVNKMLENISDWKNAPLWEKKSIDKATKSWFKYLK